MRRGLKKRILLKIKNVRGSEEEEPARGERNADGSRKTQESSETKKGWAAVSDAA